MRSMIYTNAFFVLLCSAGMVLAADSLLVQDTISKEAPAAGDENKDSVTVIEQLPESDSAFISMAGDCRYPAICSEGKTLHTTWIVTEGVTSNIYYRKSGDEGDHWTDSRMISNEHGDCYPPTIAVNSGVVHLAWVDYAETMDGELYYSRSLDGGETWEENRILIPDANGSRYPFLICRGKDVYLVWQDVENRVYFKASYNQGLTWQKEILQAKIGRQSCYCYPPAIAASKSDLVIVWSDLHDDTWGPQMGINGLQLFKRKNRIITAVASRKSSDRGKTWSKPQLLTSASITMETREEIDNPILLSDSSRFFLFWLDRRENMLGEIFYSSFDSKRMKLPLVGKKVYPVAKKSPKRPTVTFDRFGNIHFTWANFFNSESVISYGTINQEGTPIRSSCDLTNSPGSYHNPVLAKTTSGRLHILWFAVAKENNGWSKIFYKVSTNNGIAWESPEPQKRNP